MSIKSSARWVCAVVVVGLMCGAERAARAATAEVAAGTFMSTNLGGGEWQYDMTLSNNSPVNNADTTIGTFWFSWAPGEQFMEAMPTDVQAPTNWKFQITETTPQGGFGIQYVAMNNDFLTAGQSLGGFTFDSTETPTQLLGPSSFFNNPVETTSAAYTQAPFSDTTTAGDVFAVTEASVGPTPPTPPAPPAPGNGGNPVASAVPLPASAWQVLAGLIGVGMIMGMKRLKDRTAVSGF
jgi:hypothetical protein